MNIITPVLLGLGFIFGILIIGGWMLYSLMFWVSLGESGFHPSRSNYFFASVPPIILLLLVSYSIGLGFST